MSELLFTGAVPLACLALAPLYPFCNRIWGGDELEVFGSPWSGRRLTIALLLLVGVPIGYLSAGIGGAIVPVLFGVSRSIVIAKDWATPDNPKEIALAYVRHAIPAAIVAGWTGVCMVNGSMGPFDWILAVALALHAVAATVMAVSYARLEGRLDAKLMRGEISVSDCNADMAEANGNVEIAQGLTFAAAVMAWTLLRI